jgi:hypothetical protein
MPDSQGRRIPPHFGSCGGRQLHFVAGYEPELALALAGGAALGVDSAFDSVFASGFVSAFPPDSLESFAESVFALAAVSGFFSAFEGFA